jgi:RNA binding exosome subunit
MNILSADFRAIAQATENEESVERAMLYVAGTGHVIKARTCGHFGNRIVIMSIKLGKKKDLKKFVLRLKETGILQTLVDEVGERIDEECVFHFRLDKQKAYGEIMELASGNDVIDCGMKIAAYPAKRENAVRIALEDFKRLLSED